MKTPILKCLSLGIAAGAIAICTPRANAADTPMPMATPMAAPMAAPSMAPMAVSGTVLRYYVDMAGYVSAMDVQATDGVKMVHFAPSMAQSLTTMYPVGSTASVYATSSMMGGMTSYDLAGMGATMPAPSSMMMPVMVSDLDILKSEPYVTVGAKSMRYTGKLTGYVADPASGEVLAIVLDGKTLIRIPKQNRLVQASMAPEGITPLIKDASVVAYGMPEAPRYGAISPYENRVVGTGIAVGGQSLGPLGFGTVKSMKMKSLTGFNLNIPFIGGGKSPDEEMASQSGYMTYMAPGSAPATTTPAM